MSLSSRKIIDAVEYTNDSIKMPYVHSRVQDGPHPFTFNCERLSVAIARTLCSSHLDDFELWLDEHNAAWSLATLVDFSQTDFKLFGSRLARLRDFSRTSRIGEIAQGVAYLFAQEKLLFPYVVDFGFFANEKGISVASNQSTPDFVLQKNVRTKSIALLESKGTEINSSNIKGMLADGLNQCYSGDCIVATNGYKAFNKYVLCTEFAVDTLTDRTVLHFVDPIQDSKAEPDDDYIVRLHYASWFYMIGDFDNAQRLAKNETIILNKSYFKSEKFNEEEYWRIDLDGILTGFVPWAYRNNALNSVVVTWPSNFIFGISKKVVDYLSRKDAAFELPRIQLELRQDNINFYKDATLSSTNWPNE